MKYLKFLFAISNVVLCCSCATKEESIGSVNDSTVQNIANLAISEQIDSAIIIISNNDTLSSKQLIDIHQLLDEIIKNKKLSLEKVDAINARIDILTEKVKKYVRDKKLNKPIPPGTVEDLMQDVFEIRSQLEEIKTSEPKSNPKSRPEKTDTRKRIIADGISYSNEKVITDSVETLYDLPHGRYVARINKNSIVKFSVDNRSNIIDPLLVEDSVTHVNEMITNHKVLRQIRRLQIRRIKKEIN